MVIILGMGQTGATAQFNQQQMGIASLGQGGQQPMSQQHLSANHAITSIMSGKDFNQISKSNNYNILMIHVY